MSRIICRIRAGSSGRAKNAGESSTLAPGPGAHREGVPAVIVTGLLHITDRIALNRSWIADILSRSAATGSANGADVRVGQAEQRGQAMERSRG